MGAPNTPSKPGTPTPWAGTRSGFGDRLRTYLIGIGIGVMLLGMFWLMKRQAAQNQPAAPVQQSPPAATK